MIHSGEGATTSDSLPRHRYLSNLLLWVSGLKLEEPKPPAIASRIMMTIGDRSENPRLRVDRSSH